MGYGVLSTAVLIAILCWVFAARTRRVLVQVGIVLVAIALLGAAVLGHMLVRHWTVTATFLLGVAMVAVLVGGLVRDKRASASLPPSRRVVAGRIVAIVYCVPVVLALLIIGITAGVKGRTADVPTTGSILPLPDSLAIADTSDTGCGSGSKTVCHREIDIVPADGGDADVATVRTILDSLAKHHGWRLTQTTGDGSWSSCHTVGHLFDRVSECVTVYTRDSQAVVMIEQGDSW